MKRLFILLLALCLTHIHSLAQRQTLDLEEAYRLLEERYPALKNSMVLQQLYDQKVESINKGRLPDLYVKGDSKLQSENLTIEGEPGSPVPFEFELPLWSAKGYVEIQYNILNGKTNDVREAIEAYDLRTDLQEIEVDRYDLQAIINHRELRGYNE